MRLKAIGSLQLLSVVLSGVVTISIAMPAQTPVKAPVAVHLTATTDNVSGAGETIKINLFGWSTDADRDQLLAAWTLAPAPAGARGAGGRGGGGRGAGARGGGRGGRGAAAADDVAPDPSAVDDSPFAGRNGNGGRGTAPEAAARPETPESSLASALKKAPTIGIIWTSETTGYSIHYAYRLPQPDGSERIILVTDRRLGAWNNLWKPTGSAKPTDYEFSLVELRLNSKGEGEGKASVTGKVAVDSEAKTIALDGYTALPVVLKSVKRQSGT